MSVTPDPVAQTAAADDSVALTITVTTGVGVGPTKLAAFDAALLDAGVANFNLIRLSSVIPASSQIVAVEGAQPPSGSWGDRLYVVLADERVESHHEEAWAGVGWVQESNTRRGLFVEHHGHSESQVVADIAASLSTLTANRPELKFSDAHHVVRGLTCRDEPVCSLAVAVFGHEPWPESSVIDLR